jgi:hypothetical protein
VAQFPLFEAVNAYMAQYRKQFLGILKPMWAARLPEGQPGLFSPAFYTKPDATFSWTGFAPDSPTRFHAFLDFSAKRSGTFTGDVLITDPSNHLEPQNLTRFHDSIPARGGSECDCDTFPAGWETIAAKDTK